MTDCQFEDLTVPPDGYRCVVADPPWPNPPPGKHRRPGGWLPPDSPVPYDTMSIADIESMDVKSITNPDAHLYLWATNQFLPAAFGVMAAWGFKYSTTLVWVKNPMGTGYGGTYTIQTEFVLFGRRGSLAAQDRQVGNWFNWKRPWSNGKLIHSKKPPGLYSMVERISPGPRLEMFARQLRTGWDIWGDQAPNPQADIDVVN